MTESKRKFYITTPVYYVNGVPHIGHTYATLVADVMARYHRQKGDETYFLTGTDENAQKNVESAKKEGKPIQEYVNDLSSTWRETWLELGFSFDRFIRTTSTEHKNASVEFFNKVYETGDIYLGEYEGLYCVGCESFKTETELTDDGKCPDHKKKPDTIKEQNYFFKLTKYRDRLLEYIEKHPEFIQPEKRRNEVVSYIKDFMTDVSISRQSMDWGITLPIDDKHKMYVWFDALLNYFSGIGYGQDEIKFNKFWPADVQIVGKEIIKFHCAMWPAMLMSAGYELPRTIFAHGHFTIDGQKISKSLGNAINPLDLTEEYPFDAVRYFLLREITFGDDGDFSITRLKERYNSDLANDLGNLVQRALNMIGQYCDGVVDKNTDFDKAFDINVVHARIEKFEFGQALEEIWKGVSWANKHIEDNKPWELNKSGERKKLEEVLSRVYSVLTDISNALTPFMPETAERLEKFLSAEQLAPPSEPLFPRKQ